MAEYIDKYNLYISICARVNNPAIKSLFGAIISEIPAADVAPVKRGKWIATGKHMTDKCSECEFEVHWDIMEDIGIIEPNFKYCLNCGAKMEYEEKYW